MHPTLNQNSIWYFRMPYHFACRATSAFFMRQSNELLRLLGLGMNQRYVASSRTDISFRIGTQWFVFVGWFIRAPPCSRKGNPMRRQTAGIFVCFYYPYF